MLQELWKVFIEKMLTDLEDWWGMTSYSYLSRKWFGTLRVKSSFFSLRFDSDAQRKTEMESLAVGGDDSLGGIREPLLLGLIGAIGAWLAGGDAMGFGSRGMWERGGVWRGLGVMWGGLVSWRELMGISVSVWLVWEVDLAVAVWVLIAGFLCL